ncbi:MAG: zinc-ribbon domain-containing protein [Methylobacterium sp.]|jgi:predicted Zn finger-like uncharacterized protein|nr:zinc-ribbon domain-containing protein [Methylobacterium sp.]MCA3600210.1 zinc-ribbon domain-containing protein [Methylobacterium sp.]MCA3606263.1 zinc-ribbon domain-containing protein [Methylobacterium sp.]MCA3609738.1 zinc-ribbon domain-containing protein [Methylobacterium sp.]MCA3618866.1 zinc-ribbon domain-containing protein [Methylobacterium sp.]
MMRIRCPNCDSTHEVPASLLAGKPRKVRCASCRTVFEASEETDSPAPTGNPAAGAGLAAGAGAARIDWSEGDDARIGDPMATPVPPASGMDAAMGGNAAMGQDDLDALFADAPSEPAPQPVMADAPSLAPEAGAPANAQADPLEGGQDAAMLAAAAVAGASAIANAAEPKARNRRPHAKRSRPAFRLGPALGAVAATGIGTLMALTIFRHETVRIAPGLAPYFELMGLEVNSTGLEIRNVRSHIVMEDHREMLEISGQIFNITRARQPVPVIRLSLHNAEGQQIYVWTGAADNAELAAGEKTQFRRRLASPPKDATQVMVRFVARDDIVASIR